MLKVYNSLTRAKEEFVPIEPGRVRMYVCGMTVYDLCHLGHARVLVVFDVIVRHLRHLGYQVTYVRNITDIDDKIIARAQENGESVNTLTERFIRAMHEDADALGVLRPDFEPRATESMDDILGMIRKLIDKGYADPDRIGMWGHSMGGAITLRSMVVTGDVKAGVIWAGVVAPYQDLLENEHDERLFEHYLSSRVVRIGLDGNDRPIGQPGLVRSITPSPNGKFILVETLHRPFSYSVPYWRFPQRIDRWQLRLVQRHVGGGQQDGDRAGLRHCLYARV